MKKKSSARVSWNWPILMILVLAAGVRGFALSHGLPYISYSDESHHVFWAMNMTSGDLNPHQFLHPTLYFYLCFGVFLFWSITALLLGIVHSFSQVWPFYLKHPEIFFTLARGVSLTAGVASVWLVYLSGRRLWNKGTGLAAAFILSLAYLHVLYCQIAYIDATLTFLILASFTLSLRAVRKKSLSSFALAGLFSGLAISTKYNALPVCLYGPAAAFTVGWDGQIRKIDIPLFLKFCLIYAGSTAIGFSLGTPFWIFDFQIFWRDFSRVFFAYQPGMGVHQLGFTGKWNWGYYLLQPFRYGLGLPLELCGAAGLLLALKDRKFLLLIFPAAYFVIIGFIHIRVARYGLPLVPFICLGAAFFIHKITQCLNSRRRILAISLAVVIIGPSFFNTVCFTLLKTRPDTRVLAANWMRQHIPKKSGVLISAYSYAGELGEDWKIGEFDKTVFDIRGGHVSSLRALEEYRRDGYQYLVLDQWHADSIVLGTGGDPQFASLIPQYRHFLEELANQAAVTADFSPYRNSRDPVFSIESVEFPSWDLWQRKSLGPRMRIYQLIPRKNGERHAV